MTATAIVASKTTTELIEMFEETNYRQSAKTDDFEAVAMVRGWIMDQLEARNPQAFEAWLDSTEDSPARFYVA
jgi:hypothetical protein